MTRWFYIRDVDGSRSNGIEISDYFICAISGTKEIWDTITSIAWIMWENHCDNMEPNQEGCFLKPMKTI